MAKKKTAKKASSRGKKATKAKAKPKAKARPKAKAKAKPKTKAKPKAKAKAKSSTSTSGRRRAAKAQTAVSRSRRTRPVAAGKVVTGPSRRKGKGLPADFRELVYRVAAACRWEANDFDDLILLEVPVAGGRRQKISVMEDKDIVDQPIARYWTVIGPSKAIEPAFCLEANASIAYGALATHRGHLVMMDTQLISDADPLEVGTSIASMAAYADSWERRLFDRDIY